MLTALLSQHLWVFGHFYKKDKVKANRLESVGIEEPPITVYDTKEEDISEPEGRDVLRSPPSMKLRGPGGRGANEPQLHDLTESLSQHPAGFLPLRQGPSHFLHLRTPSSSTS